MIELNSNAEFDESKSWAFLSKIVSKLLILEESLNNLPLLLLGILLIKKSLWTLTCEKYLLLEKFSLLDEIFEIELNIKKFPITISVKV